MDKNSKDSFNDRDIDNPYFYQHQEEDVKLMDRNMIKEEKEKRKNKTNKFNKKN
ncbi:hypothetical protein GOQ27_13655 [Clostridium sp. D2Q-11]|uniref:Uncharacterized protein n=1 Tax=Anaeromonas frigoriresistens TaxID=2683708 RepID=A0A942UYV0_9FIRM|nr:hypothetical protein [Anaeromonas frigoriresistens]MBS4539516.1 hypothetical protein [Anaeromonas frigoriresistens]